MVNHYFLFVIFVLEKYGLLPFCTFHHSIMSNTIETIFSCHVTRVFCDIIFTFPFELQGEVVNYFNIEVVGSNGLLPNQDMFNVVAKLCRNERARVGLHKEFSVSTDG